MFELQHAREGTKKSLGLQVSEIFHSLQGEGVNTGKPAIFLRLAVCNLHCWYCDTKYTWLFNAKMLEVVQNDISRLDIRKSPEDLRIYEAHEEIRHMDLRDVEEAILRYNCNHLVLTGGEPLLQQIQLLPLLERLDRRNFYLEVETNGTIKPVPRMVEFVDQWNVSPKLETSGNTSKTREKEECFELFRKLRGAYFKFVIEDEKDLAEVEGLVQKYSLAHDKIILMPQGTTPSALEEKNPSLSTFCNQRGYRFSTRLHILLYGNVRGK